MLVEPNAHRGDPFGKIDRAYSYRDGAHCQSPLVPRTRDGRLAVINQEC